jgi:hypothetical protein
MTEHIHVKKIQKYVLVHGIDRQSFSCSQYQIWNKAVSEISGSHGNK